jgi:hypothetical protein
MIDKRFIFTVTTGRTGTGYLAHLLGIFKGTTTYHEPEPAFSAHLRAAQQDPRTARQFLLEEKIPAICRLSISPIYIETSHLFCKGFLEPWLQINQLPTPDLILLERDFREVSLSFLSLHTIPARSETGQKFMLAPSDPTCFTQVENWESLNDYQLIYWYCLEIEERKRRYRSTVEECGGKCLTTSIERLQTVTGILEARNRLNLPALTSRGWMAYFRRRGTRINQKQKAKSEVEIDPQDLERWEKEVRQRTHVRGL